MQYFNSPFCAKILSLSLSLSLKLKFNYKIIQHADKLNSNLIDTH